jgi:peptide/nickel transport system permease protein
MFLAVTVFAFVTFWVIPVNPAALNGGGQSALLFRNREHLMGLDRPLPVQYARFVWNLVGHGSLGYSYATRRSVNQIVGEAAPITASLVVGGAVLWLLIALPVGILSALRPHSLLDRVGTTFTLIGISAHPIFLGLMLAYFFGFRLGWFPITGYCDFIHPSGAEGCGGPTQWSYHLVLPWITFAVLYAALYVRMVRASVIEMLNADWVVVARAKGGSFVHVLRTHVLRNALLPIVTMFGMDIAVALGGSLFVENVWGLPGLGQTALQSLNQRDLPVTEGIVVFVATAVIVLNLVVDATYTLIDPRIRLREAH